MKCPDCDKTLRGGARRCGSCGWTQGAGGADHKPPRFERCDSCADTFRQYRKGEHWVTRNRIVGRSETGGYLCADCSAKIPPRYAADGDFGNDVAPPARSQRAFRNLADALGKKGKDQKDAHRTDLGGAMSALKQDMAGQQSQDLGATDRVRS